MSNYRKLKPEFEFCVNSIVLTVAKSNMKKLLVSNFFWFRQCYQITWKSPIWGLEVFKIEVENSTFIVSNVTKKITLNLHNSATGAKHISVVHTYLLLS